MTLGKSLFQHTMCSRLWNKQRSPFTALRKLEFIMGQQVWKSEFCYNFLEILHWWILKEHI